MANKPKEAQPINRNGYWYLVRRVPKTLVPLDGRRTVIWSTGVAVHQDPRAVRARVLVRQLDEDLQKHWSRLLSGVDPEEARRHLNNVDRAAALKLEYVPNSQLATYELEDIGRRVALLTALWGEKVLLEGPYSKAVRGDIQAVLGSTDPVENNDTAAGVTVSGMLAAYEEINRTELARKSRHQIGKWRVRRQSALDLFVTVIGGDIQFRDLSRKHALALRKYWQRRVERGEVRINSANREIRQLSGLYACLKDYHQLEGPNIFEQMRIPGGEEGKRLAFDPEFVQSRYLAEGMFAGLNPEARRIIYLCIETGLRLSEACALDESTIFVDTPVPYIDIQAANRITKTKGSIRKLPLVGVALAAMREQRDGFPRYRDNPDAASALIGRALTARGLRPGGKDQTLYSMRHTIVDRLKAVESPPDIQEDILGHKHLYGTGTTLEHKHKWLQKIAFIAPKDV